MGLDASKAAGGGSNIPKLESGVYPGRLLHVIDLGVQPQSPYKGQPKPPAHKIMLSYEFSDEFIPDEDGQEQEDKPRILSESFPLYPLSADKAKSTKRYTALDPTNQYKGDFSKLLGAPVSITVVQNVKDDGRVFENIGGLATMRAKDADKLPALVNEALVFDLDAPDMTVFKSLHEWVRKIIVANLEFAGSKLEAFINTDPDYEAADASEPAAVEDEDEGDDETPY